MKFGAHFITGQVENVRRINPPLNGAAFQLTSKGKVPAKLKYEAWVKTYVREDGVLNRDPRFCERGALNNGWVVVFPGRGIKAYSNKEFEQQFERT